MRTKGFLTLLIFSIFATCQTPQMVDQDDRYKEIYQDAILDAMSPAPDEISNNLTSIDKENKELIRKKIDSKNYILVVAWKGTDKYYKEYENNSKPYNTDKYDIWVTVAPELLKRMKKEQYEDFNLRLKQLLGLPPTASYNYFIEFWVKPEDLFRPCPDNEVNDKQCNLCFPDTATSLYRLWINENRIVRYYNCNLYDKYPWTQLGYTYDWNSKNASHIGLSEFVIHRHKEIYVNKIYKTEEYLNKK